MNESWMEVLKMYAYLCYKPQGNHAVLRIYSNAKTAIRYMMDYLQDQYTGKPQYSNMPDDQLQNAAKEYIEKYVIDEDGY